MKTIAYIDNDNLDLRVADIRDTKNYLELDLAEDEETKVYFYTAVISNCVKHNGHIAEIGTTKYSRMMGTTRPTNEEIAAVEKEVLEIACKKASHGANAEYKYGKHQYCGDANAEWWLEIDGGLDYETMVESEGSVISITGYEDNPDLTIQAVPGLHEGIDCYDDLVKLRNKLSAAK